VTNLNSETTMNPYENTPTARLIADRIRDLSHRKTQAEIASDAGFANANMMTFLKNGRNKVPLDRVPSLAKALEVDPAMLMRLALDQAVGATSAKAITEIFGTPVTENERGWLMEIREASDNADPRLTGRSRAALRGIFGK
jgi:transcriptional regulator with XRE-family HTH domain